MLPSWEGKSAAILICTSFSAAIYLHHILLFAFQLLTRSSLPSFHSLHRVPLLQLSFLRVGTRIMTARRAAHSTASLNSCLCTSGTGLVFSRAMVLRYHAACTSAQLYIFNLVWWIFWIGLLVLQGCLSQANHKWVCVEEKETQTLTISVLPCQWVKIAQLVDQRPNWCCADRCTDAVQSHMSGHKLIWTLGKTDIYYILEWTGNMTYYHFI